MRTMSGVTGFAGSATSPGSPPAIFWLHHLGTEGGPLPAGRDRAGGEDVDFVGDAVVGGAWRRVLEETLVVLQAGDVDLGVGDAFDLTGGRVPGLAAVGEHERVGVAGDEVVDLRPLEDGAVEIVVRPGEVLADALVAVDVDLEPLVEGLRQVFAVVRRLVGVALGLIAHQVLAHEERRWCLPPRGNP